MFIKNKKCFERKQAVQAQHDCDRWLNMLAKGSPAGLNYCSGNKRSQLILFTQCNIQHIRAIIKCMICNV